MVTELSWFSLIPALSTITAMLAIVSFSSVIHTLHGAAMQPTVVGKEVAEKTEVAGKTEAPDVRAEPIILAEGNQSAANQPLQAAGIFAQGQQAIRLPNQKTLTVIGAGRNTTIVFPLTMDMFSSFFWHEHIARNKEVKNEYKSG